MFPTRVCHRNNRFCSLSYGCYMRIHEYAIHNTVRDKKHNGINMRILESYNNIIILCVYFCDISR